MLLFTIAHSKPFYNLICVINDRIKMRLQWISELMNAHGSMQQIYIYYRTFLILILQMLNIIKLLLWKTEMCKIYYWYIIIVGILYRCVINVVIFCVSLLTLTTRFPPISSTNNIHAHSRHLATWQSINQPLCCLFSYSGLHIMWTVFSLLISISVFHTAVCFECLVLIIYSHSLLVLYSRSKFSLLFVQSR